MQGLDNAGAAAIDNYLYVWQQVTPPGAPIHSELTRVNPTTGKILGKVSLGSFGLSQAAHQLLIADGSLWVAATDPSGGPIAHGGVLRFQPETLQPDGRTLLAGSGTGQESVAFAGGWLWVADGGTLYKISPSSAAVAATIGLGTADQAQVATNPGGTALIVHSGQFGRAFRPKSATHSG